MSTQVEGLLKTTTKADARRASVAGREWKRDIRTDIHRHRHRHRHRTNMRAAFQACNIDPHTHTPTHTHSVLDRRTNTGTRFVTYISLSLCLCLLCSHCCRHPRASDMTCRSLFRVRLALVLASPDICARLPLSSPFLCSSKAHTHTHTSEAKHTA